VPKLSNIVTIMGKYLRGIVQSLYSADLYREAATAWRGIGGVFLLLLSIIATILWVIPFQATLKTFEEQTAPQLISQVPTLTLRSGKLSTNAREPYTITIGEGENAESIVIDTKRADMNVNELADYMKKSQISAMLTERSFIYTRSDLHKVEILDLSKFPDGTLTPEGLKTLTTRVTQVVFWVAVGVSPFAIWFWLFVKALLGSILGLILNAIAGSKLPYATILRLSSVVFAPVVLITAAVAAAGVHFPFLGLLVFVVYYIFAIWSCRPKPSIHPKLTVGDLRP
jgi:Protein of unknown function (DUF1189)